MSENIDINVAIINEEVTISAVNNLNEVVVNAINSNEEINVTANTNLIQININTAPLSIINPQNYDLSQFTNISPNPFVQQSTLSSYVPISRILTINGVSQDLSTNRSWTIPGATWGSITGTLAAQTDLQAALDAKQDDIILSTTGSSGAATLIGSTLNIPNYTISGLGGVPTSRTLTINGTSYDLSADRSWTISTGITIGTTAITSGTVGRVLFEGTGNVVQESANLFWDNTNGRLGIGTSSPSAIIHSVGSVTASGAIARGNFLNNTLVAAANSDVLVGLDINPVFTVNTSFVNTSTSLRINANYAPPSFSGNNNQYGIDISPTFRDSNVSIGLRINPNFINISSGGAWALSIENTSYGAIRQTSTATPNIFAGVTSIGANISGNTGFSLNVNSSIKVGTVNTTGQHLAIAHSEGGATFSSIRNQFTSTSAQMLIDVASQGNLRLFGTGNVAINSSTDAGFRLDVNGTARVSGSSFFATTSGTLAVGTTTIVNMNYGEVPKTYLTGGTFINGTLQLPTSLRVIATGGGIQFAQQSEPSPNSNLFFGNDSTGVYYGNYGTLGVRFLVGATARMTLASTTGNVLINTTTDAGFKLDVNGTARVQSGLIVQGLTIGRGGGNANSVAIGLEAAPLTTATQNCAVGYRALFNNTGGDNTAVGAFYAMFANTTGTRNTGIGAYALNGNTTGQYNTAIGYNTSSGNFSNSTILGYGAAASADNQFVVGSSGVNAGAVTTEVNASTKVWNVFINGVAQKILLA